MKKRSKTTTHAGIKIREVRPGYFMVDLRRGGKTDRVCFGTLEEAKTHAEFKAGDLRNEGLSAMTLPSVARQDAARALAMLKGSATLTAAAGFWLKHHPIGESVTVRALADQWILSLERQNCRTATLAERRQKLNRLCADLGDRPACSITAHDLQAWLDAKKLSPVTRDTYRRCYGALFQFGVKQNGVEYNPVTKLDRVKIDEKMPAFFTADQTAAVMAEAEAARCNMVPYLAVQFFAGLRPGEAAGLTWGQIDVAERIIRVLPETSKVRQSRLVDIPNNLAVWLAQYRPHGVGDATRIAPDTKRAIHFRRQRIAEVAKVEWIQDGPRHTFATMHFAEHQDAGKLAAQMGHVGGVDILYRHYRGLATAKEAAKFWKIKPAKKGAALRIALEDANAVQAPTLAVG